jgi:hypothetical protein
LIVQGTPSSAPIGRPARQRASLAPAAARVHHREGVQPGIEPRHTLGDGLQHFDGADGKTGILANQLVGTQQR